MPISLCANVSNCWWARELGFKETSKSKALWETPTNCRAKTLHGAENHRKKKKKTRIRHVFKGSKNRKRFYPPTQILIAMIDWLNLQFQLLNPLHAATAAYSNHLFPLCVTRNLHGASDCSFTVLQQSIKKKKKFVFDDACDSDSAATKREWH